MKLRRKVLRAREEIERCNVETRRIHSAIVHEQQLFRKVEAQYANTLIAGPLHEFIISRRRQNRVLYWRVQQIHALPGFSGDQTVGVRVAASPSTSTSSPMPQASTSAAPTSMPAAPVAGPSLAPNVSHLSSPTSSSMPFPVPAHTSSPSATPAASSSSLPTPASTSLAAPAPIPSPVLTSTSSSTHTDPFEGFRSTQANFADDDDLFDDTDFDNAGGLFGDPDDDDGFMDSDFDEELEEQVGSLTSFLAGLNT